MSFLENEDMLFHREKLYLRIYLFNCLNFFTDLFKKKTSLTFLQFFIIFFLIHTLLMFVVVVIQLLSHV